MEFKWTMTEKDWERMMADHKNPYKEDCYGHCLVGKLSAEFNLITETRGRSEYSCACVYLYCLDINDGYASTNSGRPYTILEHGLKNPIKSKTYGSFKENFEEMFKKEMKPDSLTVRLNKSHDIIKMANVPTASVEDWR